MWQHGGCQESVQCDAIVVSWNSILGGFAMHGHDKEALTYFEQMCEEGVQPDDITFVCLLSACSHAGLVDEGMRCYASMTTVYMVSAKLEHYTCMVNLLGRAGYLQEAENMIKTMPHKQHVNVWKALLGACRIHGNVEKGERVAKQIRIGARKCFRLCAAIKHLCCCWQQASL
jgi:pentatricopeptide repeat protein